MKGVLNSQRAARCTKLTSQQGSSRPACKGSVIDDEAIQNLEGMMMDCVAISGTGRQSKLSACLRLRAQTRDNKAMVSEDPIESSIRVVINLSE